MTLQLGDTVPDFTQESSMGTINFYEWMEDKWAVLFSHPADYTPVCTTELGEVAKLKPEFDKRNVKVIALSVDDTNSHQGWIQDINETQKPRSTIPFWQMPIGKFLTSMAWFTQLPAFPHRPIGVCDRSQQEAPPYYYLSPQHRA